MMNDPKPDANDSAARAAAPLVIKSVRFEKSGTRREHYAVSPPMPQVAFVGRSNVGKSSLINCLANQRQLARVSNTPGRTQLVNFFIVNDRIRFVDLPGYGFAKTSKDVKATWDRMITEYLMKNPYLRAVCTLFDVRRELSEEDFNLIEWLRTYGIPFIAVITKADKLGRGAQAQAVREFRKALEPLGPAAIHMFSAQTRQGKDELLSTIGQLSYQSDTPDRD
jgi:GTP-binding protein